MKGCWWNLADWFFRYRFAGLAAALFLTLSSPTHSIEPVFEVRERSVTEILSPAQLPIGFYTFEPDEYWADPLDSY